MKVVFVLCKSVTDEDEGMRKLVRCESKRWVECSLHQHDGFSTFITIYKSVLYFNFFPFNTFLYRTKIHKCSYRSHILVKNCDPMPNIFRGNGTIVSKLGSRNKKHRRFIGIKVGSQTHLKCPMVNYPDPELYGFWRC